MHDGAEAMVRGRRFGRRLAECCRCDGPGGQRGQWSARVLRGCLVCHTMDKNGASKIGSSLHGVLGRRAGTVKRFVFSTAMIGAGITWDEKTLGEYSRGPQKSRAGDQVELSWPQRAGPARRSDRLSQRSDEVALRARRCRAPAHRRSSPARGRRQACRTPSDRRGRRRQSLPRCSPCRPAARRGRGIAPY